MKKKVICPICPNLCNLEEGEVGLCAARKAVLGEVVPINYGLVTSIGLDPIEKKPLRNYASGSKILSVGSFGCNLFCPFCQNHTISRGRIDSANFTEIMPENLVEEALKLRKSGNIGIAYTYNEPLVGYEYVLDASKLAREKGLKNVLVTNGYINPGPLMRLLPYIDAANVDLKAFSNDFYLELGGRLDPVKNSIETMQKSIHLEITTLIVPDKNDSEEEMDKLSTWIASLRRDIPLHITRFFPRYEYLDSYPTPLETIKKLSAIAKDKLKYVYEGNC